MRGYHLAGLSVAAKLVYTIFLLFVLLGIWSSVEIYDTRLGGTAAAGAQGAVAERYGQPVAPSQPGDGGPDLELPPPDGAVVATAGADEPQGDARWGWILDVFHQHLFSICVVWLVLAHLFMLSRLHPAITGAVVITSGIVTLLHVLAPLIIYQTGAVLWLMPVTGVGMAATWLMMTLWTALAMWFGLGRPSEAD